MNIQIKNSTMEQLEGFKLPLLVIDGCIDPFSDAYVMYLYEKGYSFSTLETSLRQIVLFYRYCNECKIDFYERMATLAGLDVSEIETWYTDNFIGEIADKVRVLRKEGKTDEEIMEYLDHVIVSVHWTPYGACIRNLALKPCQYNVRCIRGQNDEGCSEFIVNKSDDEAIAGIKRLVKKSEMTLGRLFNYQQR